jgi:hypothetical protein
MQKRQININFISGEIWVNIPHIDGLIVSSLGRVYELIRIINGIKKGGYMCNIYTDKTGYKVLAIRRNNKNLFYKVHRLIAMGFIPNPENKPIINHINGVKGDNRVENIEWATYSENIKHAHITGLNKRIGDTHTWAKLNSSIVIKIREEYSLGGVTMKSLGIKYSVSYGTIQAIIRGKNWKHIK